MTHSADVAVNGVTFKGSAAIVVIQPGQRDQSAAVAAAEQLVIALTGRQPVTVQDWDGSVTVTAGRRSAGVPDGAPQLTREQQLAEDLAAVYRAAAASEVIAERAGVAYEKMRHALRALVGAAWGLNVRDARAVVGQLGGDPRPVWVILYERRGVPLDLALAS